MDMPNVQNPFLSRAHDPPNDSMPTRCEHGGPQPESSENRGSAASTTDQPMPATAGATTWTSANMSTSSRRCCCPPSSCSHHLAPNLPNAGIVRGGEHGSFSRGHEASSSMKGCSLAMNLRCVAPIRHSARSTCSTLSARCANLHRFTRSVRRRYLLCENASRVWHRTLTKTRRRRVSVS